MLFRHPRSNKKSELFKKKNQSYKKKPQKTRVDENGENQRSSN